MRGSRTAPRAARTAGLLASSLVVLGVAGEAKGTASLAIERMLYAAGRCDHLIVAGQDRTAACRPRILNATFKNGHLGFTFLFGVRSLTFDGYGPDQVKLAPNNVRQPITTVLYLDGHDALRGAPATAMPANGSCAYANPFLGKPARIVCTTTTRGLGVFAGSFTTDGAAPREIPTR